MTPTWRLVLVEPTATTEDSVSPALLFALHHGAFDGTSRNRSLLEFFKAYAQVVNSMKNTTPIPSSAIRVPIFQEKTLSSHVIHMSWPAFILKDVCFKTCCTRNFAGVITILHLLCWIHPGCSILDRTSQRLDKWFINWTNTRRLS